MVPRDRGGGGRRCPWAFVLLVLAAVLDSGTGYRPMRLAPLRGGSKAHDAESSPRLTCGVARRQAHANQNVLLRFHSIIGLP